MLTQCVELQLEVINGESVPRRNLETNVENEETILNELKAARKELKKREDDPILLDKIKALKLRLEKVKQESDFRDEYKDDPYVLQCLVRATRLHAVDATRLHQRRRWVVSGPNLSRFGPNRDSNGGRGPDAVRMAPNSEKRPLSWK